MAFIYSEFADIYLYTEEMSGLFNVCIFRSLNSSLIILLPVTETQDEDEEVYDEEKEDEAEQDEKDYAEEQAADADDENSPLMGKSEK